MPALFCILISLFFSACATKSDAPGNDSSTGSRSVETQPTKEPTEDIEACVRLARLDEVLSVNGYDFAPYAHIEGTVRKGGLLLLWTTWNENQKYVVLQEYSKLITEDKVHCSSSDGFYQTVADATSSELARLKAKFGPDVSAVPLKKSVCTVKNSNVSIDGQSFYYAESFNELRHFLGKLVDSKRCQIEKRWCFIDSGRLYWGKEMLYETNVQGELNWAFAVVNELGFCK